MVMGTEETLDAIIAILGIGQLDPEKYAKCIALLEALERESYNDGYRGGLW